MRFEQQKFQPSNQEDFFSFFATKAKKTLGLSPDTHIDFQEKSVGTNCQVFLGSFISTETRQRVVLKIFGAGKQYSAELIAEVKDEIIKYQQQLLQSGLFLPFQTDPKSIEIVECNDQVLLFVIEPFYGNSQNHFDVINSDKEKENIQKIILRDLELITSMTKEESVELFGNKIFTLLKSGMDTKPDNFVTHQNTSVYIDLFPPLYITQGQVYYHESICGYFSKEAWTYLMGTLEGTMLRYLKSAEFRLKEPEKIRQFYPLVSDFLEKNIPKEGFEYMKDQIQNEFSDINKAYSNEI